MTNVPVTDTATPQAALYAAQRYNGNIMDPPLHTGLIAQGWTVVLGQNLLIAAGTTATFGFYLPKWIKQLEEVRVQYSCGLAGFDFKLDGTNIRIGAASSSYDDDITSLLINGVLSQPGGRHPKLGAHSFTMKNNGADNTGYVMLEVYCFTQPAKGAPSDT